jgi:Fe2+ or Zn2+ uptake regulation protein
MEEKTIRKNSIKNDSITPDYFTMCFEGMTRDKGLAMSSIYGYIWRKAKKYGYSYVSHRTIHRDLKLDITTVRKNLNKLVELKFLIVLDLTKNKRPRNIDPRTISYIPNDRKYNETYIIQEDEEENDETCKLSPEEIDKIIDENS